MAYVFLSLPIRQKLDQFRTFMKEHEYHERTIRGYHTYVSRFLRSNYYEPGNCDLKGQINEFLKNEAIQALKTFISSRAAQYLFYNMETGTQYPKNNAESNIEAIEHILLEFRNHLYTIKHLTELTIDSEISHVRRFLEFAYSKYLDKLIISELDANDIRSFFVDEIHQLKPGSKGRMATSIRNFFRYLKFSGMSVSESVFKLPLSPAVWKQTSVSTVLSDEEFNSLSTAFDKNTPTGVRNYAIIMCFTELGLRCLEVANLSLDDFKWHESIVTIRNTKNHTDRRLPISAAVGNAITDYLKYFRPQTVNRTLFVRFSHAKGNAMGRSQIRNVVRLAYSKIGIDEKITGTHILRRTVASRIYNNGNSLKMVADILGHESLDSTVAYTKINKENLLQVAGVWPGRSSYND